MSRYYVRWVRLDKVGGLEGWAVMDRKHLRYVAVFEDRSATEADAARREDR